MKNIYLALCLILIGMALADDPIICTGDTSPNLATTLKINCTTEASNSRCYAVVYDNSTPPIILDEYPNTCFGEDRICINTFDDGSFITNIFINDKIFYTGTNYTAQVKCFNPADNSTNSTSFLFYPTGYASPDWITEGWLFLGKNVMLFLTFLVAGGLVTILWWYLKG